MDPVMPTTEAYPIRYWENPGQDEVADSVPDLLQQLDGPTWIYLQGQDSSRCRVITTLLHGNEPSGLHALHNWLRSDYKPVVDLYCFIGSVEAAREPPGFHYRQLPGTRDLNRCFRPPFNDEQGRIAADLLHRICAVRPEAVIDIHNTSGAGPSFAVACDNQIAHRSISSLFTERLIITDIRLGALMEIEEGFPVTTIECGGAHDPHAHQLAWQGFKNFAFTEQLFSARTEPAKLDVYQHPMRVELFSGTEITFAESAQASAELTLHADIERFNFTTAPRETALGWLGKQGLSCITVRDSHGSDHTHRFFENRDGELITRQALKLFMITKDINIAISDCLFYLVALE